MTDDIMVKRASRQMTAAICAAAMLFAGGSILADTLPLDGLQQRIGFVDKLLNESSAARQVQESDVAAAHDMRARAVDRYDDALRAFDAGDSAAVEAALSEAIKLMYAAANASQKKGVATEKSDRDYQNRRASVDALLVAHQRISKEKGQRNEHKELRQKIDAELATADKMLAASEPTQARRQLDGAYEQVKVAVEQLRDGDTLVRELKFDTAEDEYDYELDRNDTHQMLVTVLLQERLEDDRVRDRVTPLVATAKELRSVAESQASNKQFKEAIATLEQSTRELVKAIRGAGVYIPG